jgi:hypothetical protein
MKKILPNQREINILVSYLPKLYEEGFNLIKKWHGGNENKDGSISFLKLNLK